MNKKLKKINWSTIYRVTFVLYTSATILSIYFSERSLLIVVAFFVIATYNVLTTLEEFVRIYRINSNINIQRYLNERGLKKEEEQ